MLEISPVCCNIKTVKNWDGLMVTVAVVINKAMVTIKRTNFIQNVCLICFDCRLYFRLLIVLTMYPENHPQ